MKRSQSAPLQGMDNGPIRSERIVACAKRRGGLRRSPESVGFGRRLPPLSTKGYAIVLDSVVALTFVLVIVASFLGIVKTSSVASESTMVRLHYVSEDALDVLNKRGVLDYAGEEWAAADGNRSSGHFANANITLSSHLEAILPPNVGYRLTIDDDIVAENLSRVPMDSSSSLTHSTRLLVGYGKGLPTRGDVARASLNNIKEKETSSYTYFGGFVGEGNITVYVRDIPADAEVISCCMEMNTPSDFDLLINDQAAGLFSSASSGDMSATLRDRSQSGCPAPAGTGSGCVGGCPALINKGSDNKFELKFRDSDISNHYVGGGYIHVLYSTNIMDTDEVVKSSRYYFPGIDGVINLYDSFFVPGIIESMTANLRFRSNYSVALNIGDVQVYNNSEGNASEQAVSLSSAYFDTLPFIKSTGAGQCQDPKCVSLNTVPIRFATGNISGEKVLDMALVTDRSGSMLQSGWTLSSPDRGLEFNDIDAPLLGYSAVQAFTVDGPSIPCSLEAEAELFTANSPSSTHSWALQSGVGGYSGSGYMGSSPNSDTSWNAWSDYSTRSPVLRFNFSFPSAGTYYVWLRGYGATGSDDSVHVGFDGAQNPSSDRISGFSASWAWTKATMDGADATIIATAGNHSVDVYMREDGFLLDKVLLTTDSAYNPSSGACVSSLNGSLAVGIDWGRTEGYNGSESSEFVVNLQRPDGTWVFQYPGAPNLAGGQVDPGGGTVGQANEYYSGISTKPQILQIDNPQKGTWHVAAYGWNLRPKTGPPASQPVNITVHLDLFNQTGDEISRSPTIISLDAAIDGQKDFVDSMEGSDRASYVVFGSYAELRQALTSDKALLQAAIDATGSEGGTAIHTGINTASQHLIASARQNATKIMILLTDGQNDNGPAPVLAAAAAAKGNGTVVFAIGLTAFVNHDLLREVASRPEYYYYTPDGSGLSAIYAQINEVITSDYRIQTVNVSGGYVISHLYPDSYIEFTYAPINQSSYGEVSLKRSTCRFDDTVSCSGTVDIPSGAVISDAKVTSYSGPYWTNYLEVSNSGGSQTVYQLSDWFSGTYLMLGDPFIVNVPVDTLLSGEDNIVTVGTGYNSSQTAGCSPDDKAIYTLRMHTMSGYGDVFQDNNGCNWTIQFEDDTSFNSPLPSSYNGTNSCTFTNTSIDFTDDDAMNDAIYRLLSQLDLDHDGKVDLLFDPAMIDFEMSQASGIQSLWGPAKFKLIVWM